MERRGTHSTTRSMATLPTLRGGTTAIPGVERIAQRARQQPETCFSAQMHHFSVEHLRVCFESLDGKKAVGSAGVAKEQYGEALEDNLQRWYQKLHQLSYRPQAVRRVEIPQEDGSTRPLGIRCLEDKSIQELTRRILEALYEPTFLDTSYGFRAGRSCHEALRQLNQEVMRQRVHWVADWDLAQCFDTMPHQAILSVLALRIKDRQFLQLMARRLKAGVQTPGGVVVDELGSPQGSIVSPVIAHSFLDHVLDQWVSQVVRQHGRGYCSIIRYADDTLVLCEREDDAHRFMRVLPLRLAKDGLTLNQTKTQLLRFGKQAAWQAIKRGEKLPTRDFLGFTHYGGRSRTGTVRLKRKTSKKRLRRALVDLKQWLRQERNARK